MYKGRKHGADVCLFHFITPPHALITVCNPRKHDRTAQPWDYSDTQRARICKANVRSADLHHHSPLHAQFAEHSLVDSTKTALPENWENKEVEATSPFPSDNKPQDSGTSHTVPGSHCPKDTLYADQTGITMYARLKTTIQSRASFFSKMSFGWAVELFAVTDGTNATSYDDCSHIPNSEVLGSRFPSHLVANAQSTFYTGANPFDCSESGTRGARICRPIASHPLRWIQTASALRIQSCEHLSQTSGSENCKDDKCTISQSHLENDFGHGGFEPIHSRHLKCTMLVSRWHVILLGRNRQQSWVVHRHIFSISSVSSAQWHLWKDRKCSNCKFSDLFHVSRARVSKTMVDCPIFKMVLHKQD